MVKMTSVVGYIAVQDLTKVSDIIRSRTMEAFFPLIVTAIIYFALANVMTAMISLVERIKRLEYHAHLLSDKIYPAFFIRNNLSTHHNFTCRRHFQQVDAA